jgi:hypothetical protein
MHKCVQKTLGRADRRASKREWVDLLSPPLAEFPDSRRSAPAHLDKSHDEALNIADDDVGRA